jgi:hypothetical protein
MSRITLRRGNLETLLRARLRQLRRRYSKKGGPKAALSLMGSGCGGPLDERR